MVVFVKKILAMGKLKQISDFERFYWEMKKIRSELNQLIKDMGSMLSADRDKNPDIPTAIDPRTGKPF